MIIEVTHPYRHKGPELITDFTGFREVKVKKASPDMVDAKPNCCIDNSFDLAELGDIKVVQGYIALADAPLKAAIFHYWNYDNEEDVYWDCTPNLRKMRYYVKEASK
jgi:hypothetical protein